MSEAFELPATTWKIIQSCCPDKEANEMKRVIGQSLLEEARDLHSEVSPIYKLNQLNYYRTTRLTCCLRYGVR